MRTRIFFACCSYIVWLRNWASQAEKVIINMMHMCARSLHARSVEVGDWIILHAELVVGPESHNPHDLILIRTPAVDGFGTIIMSAIYAVLTSTLTNSAGKY
ncbi:hypothetical protein N7493_009450 [Penicillium malachiteum]|uniref:Secreted protein n=1 Tax=Penicillium malachiteum TaxID=1324776 RepID=A0AAD6HEI3_9EURO|nr:hypothetical protein N7493_009450 [Penicillium malachiteum]